MSNSVISIDLAKNVFQVCVFDEHRKPIFNKKVTRAKLLETVMNQAPDRIVMEACYSSNYWGRVFLKMNRSVGLIPAYQVKPFVVGNKNDSNDAVAIGYSQEDCVLNDSLRSVISSIMRWRKGLIDLLESDITRRPRATPCVGLGWGTTPQHRRDPS